MEPWKHTGSRPIDGPVEEIETEGQRQLQALLKKQLNTNISMKQHFQHKKEFSSSAVHKSGVEELAGVVTLTDYQTLEKTDGYIEEMKGYGLTEEEILLKLQYEEPEASTVKRSRLTNPDHEQARLLEIERKIQAKRETLAQPDTFSNTKSISRHEMQLEKSLSHSSQSSKFLHGVLIKEKAKCPTVNQADPMNNLEDIMQTITYKPFKRKHRKHGKDDSYKLDCTLECCSKDDDSVETSGDKCQNSGADCPLEHRVPAVATCMERPPDYVSKDSELENPENNHIKSHSVESQSKLNAPEVDKHEAVNNKDTESIPEDVIRSYKLSAEEIKKLPRFENYEPGELNNVLFLKNLSAKVAREDLVALFNRYHTNSGEKIDYKLMTGRMKGQAFVTFQNSDTATKALELVHGYDFKGKPIIIAYGKKSKKT